MLQPVAGRCDSGHVRSSHSKPGESGLDTRINLSENEITRVVEQFLAKQPNLILATLRRDGVPQLSPVWYLWRDNAFFISTNVKTAKWSNLLRDPRCSGLIDGPEAKYVYISGAAELDDGDVYDITEELVRRYKSEEELGPYMEEIYRNAHRTIIRLVPERVVTFGFE